MNVKVRGSNEHENRTSNRSKLIKHANESQFHISKQLQIVWCYIISSCLDLLLKTLQGSNSHSSTLTRVIPWQNKPENIQFLAKKTHRKWIKGKKIPFCRLITLSYVALVDYQLFQFHSNINRLDRQYQEYIFVRVFVLAKNNFKNFKKNLVLPDS